MEDIFKSLNSKQADADKLHPGNNVLRDISNTFVHIIKNGTEYPADIFKDGKAVKQL